MSIIMQIQIDNLKCGGCEKSILNGLSAIGDISDVSVDLALQMVQFTGQAQVRPLVASKLLSMGYPEKDTLTGLSAGVANAKSYISCAIGTLS